MQALPPLGRLWMCPWLVWDVCSTSLLSEGSQCVAFKVAHLTGNAENAETSSARNALDVFLAGLGCGDSAFFAFFAQR